MIVEIIRTLLSAFGLWIALFLITFFAGYLAAERDIEVSFFASWLVSTVLAFALLVGVLYA